jgi:hypothetical protein
MAWLTSFSCNFSSTGTNNHRFGNLIPHEDADLIHLLPFIPKGQEGADLEIAGGDIYGLGNLTPVLKEFKDLPVGIAVVNDEQLTAGQADTAGHGWRSPVPIVGPLEQNKIKKSKGFDLKGLSLPGKIFFRSSSGRSGGLPPASQKKAPYSEAFGQFLRK